MADGAVVHFCELPGKLVLFRLAQQLVGDGEDAILLSRDELGIQLIHLPDPHHDLRRSDAARVVPRRSTEGGGEVTSAVVPDEQRADWAADAGRGVPLD